MTRRGQKRQKTGEQCPVLRVRPVNYHIKLRFLLIRRSGRTLRTLFPPTESAIFQSEAAKKILWKIRETVHLEKGLLKPNARQSEGFLRRPRDPGASKTANDQGKNMAL